MRGDRGLEVPTTLYSCRRHPCRRHPSYVCKHANPTVQKNGVQARGTPSAFPLASCCVIAEKVLPCVCLHVLFSATRLLSYLLTVVHLHRTFFPPRIHLFLCPTFLSTSPVCRPRIRPVSLLRFASLRFACSPSWSCPRGIQASRASARCPCRPRRCRRQRASRRATGSLRCTRRTGFRWCSVLR